MVNNMHNDIEREYERLEEYKDNRVVGGVIRQTENAINEWEDRLTTELAEEKQHNFKMGEVYATQIKNMERLVYAENTYGYKTTPVEFKGSKEKFISSLYTFFTFDEIVPSDNLENIITGDLPRMRPISHSTRAMLFTEIFSGKKFICIDGVDMDKQKIWELMNSGVVLSINGLKEVDDDLLIDIGRETLARKEDIESLIIKKQEEIIRLIEKDKEKDKSDALIMARAEDVMRSARNKEPKQEDNAPISQRNKSKKLRFWI